MNSIPLTACTPDPLMSYLKALGVFRLIAQNSTHGDPSVKASWGNGCFHLHTKLDQQQIEDFFYTHYQPTPIVVPWSGGDFFGVNPQAATPKNLKAPPTSSEIIEAFLATTSDRFKNYRDTISLSLATLQSVGILKKDDMKKAKKSRYLATLRSTAFSENAVGWIDATTVIEEDQPSFSALLGSGGGSDGNTHFSDNFMQNLWDVLPDFAEQRKEFSARKDDPQKAFSISMLKNTLWGEPVAGLQAKRTSSLFDPGAVGGANMTQGFDSDSYANPWNVIFAIEGTLAFAGMLHRKLENNRGGKPAFPFQVRINTGCNSNYADKESAGKELWMPLWRKQVGFHELYQILMDGRADLNGKQVSESLHFARAATSLGTDRGIDGFSRFGVVKGRIGGDNYNTTTALGYFPLKSERYSDLIHDTDPWLDAFRRCCAKDAPARFSSALRRIESAIFDYCRYGESASRFQLILRAFGNAERELALTSGKCGQGGNCRPLSGLSAEWIPACNDGSHEFDIALALASIYQASPKIGSLRSNLEPLDPQKKYPIFLESSKAAVWKGSNLCDNLSATLARRLMDADRYGVTQSPLASSRTASLASISAFLDGNTDDEKIAELLWGLIALKSFSTPTAQTPFADREPEAIVPAPYALLKLIYLARPLEIDGKKITPYAEPAILPLLRRGNLDSACSVAARRLRSCGLQPIPHCRLHATARSADWQDARIHDIARLSAALLIPISSPSTDTLLTMVSRKLEPATR